MAVVVTDNRIVWSDADNATNWSATATAAATDPVPIEATNRIGYVVGATTQDAFFTSTGRALNNHIVYCWIFGRIVADTIANGGYSVHIGDGTNRVAYHVAGDDVAGFRHESGPVGWQCLVLDTANLPATKTVRAGSEATLLTNLSTDVEAFTVIAGYGDNLAAAAQTDGIYFRYTHNVNDGKWELVAEVGGVETVADSGITVDVNTWYNLRIETYGHTSATFYIDDVNVGTIATGLPEDANYTGINIGIFKSAGTSTRAYRVDWVYLYAMHGNR
jgi:hypothetical protein